VHQSRSKRGRRHPSPRMIKVTVHKETRGQLKNDQTLQQPTHNHDSSAHRQHPAHLHWSSALVRGRSTQFIANPCRCSQRPCPKRGYISAIFPPFWNLVHSTTMHWVNFGHRWAHSSYTQTSTTQMTARGLFLKRHDRGIYSISGVRCLFSIHFGLSQFMRP